MSCLQTPWIKSDKSGDDAMTRKAEENMTRIGCNSSSSASTSKMSSETDAASKEYKLWGLGLEISKPS